MALLACIGRCNVIGDFARRCGAVVAGDARLRDRRVIHLRSRKESCC